VTNTTCFFLHKTPRCVFNYKYQFILCTAWCFCAPIIGIHILYIKKNVCLFVCLFVPYTNPHFWTDRNQTLHKTPPWSGRDRRVCMCPQYFTFPTFSTYFVGSRCRFVRSRWLPAPHCTATVLYPWCGASWCDVTHGGLCNENMNKWTECVCVCENGNLIRRNEVTNELNLQLHCSYTNDNVEPI